jgi:hypothetical protein
MKAKTDSSTYHILAPFRSTNRDSFERHLFSRFPCSEDAVEYADRMIDRQINKANGLLAFNAILFTALTLKPNSAQPTLTTIGSVAALIATIPLLLLLIVKFGSINEYKCPQDDFKASCRTFYIRTYAIAISVLCSLVATLVSLWLLLHC